MISTGSDGYSIGPIRRATLLAGGLSSSALAVMTVVGVMEITAWPQRLLFASLWSTLAVLALVSARPKVRLRREGIRIVNRFRTVVVPWDEFHRFVTRRAYLRQYMGHVETVDGRFIPVQVLVTRGELGGRDSRLEAMVARLNEMADSGKFPAR